MVKFVVILLFLLIFVLFRSFNRYYYGRDALAPLSFFVLFFFLTRIPRLILAENNIYHPQQYITDDMIWLYFVIMSFFLLAVLIGGIFNAQITAKDTYGNSFGLDYYNSHSKLVNYSSMFRVGIVCFLIGAASRIFLIEKAGGILYIWSNLQRRAFMLSGYGYLGYLSLCITFGLAAIEIYVLNCKKYKGIFMILCFIGIMLNLSFGARSPVIKMLLGLFFVYWYASPNKINWKHFIKIKYAIIVIVVLFAIKVMPTFRTYDFQFNTKSFANVLNNSSNNIGSIFNEISTYDEDVFVFDYFSKNPFWNGKSYLGLLTAWLPRSFFAKKSPVDDGMYLRALMKGHHVEPPMTIEELGAKSDLSSVPFTSTGILYANFGIVGIIVGGMLIGFILVSQYQKMLKNNFMLDDILLYQFLCIRLTLSTKGLVELFMTIIIIKVFCGLIYKMSNVQKNVVLQR